MVLVIGVLKIFVKLVDLQLLLAILLYHIVQSVRLVQYFLMVNAKCALKIVNHVTQEIFHFVSNVR